MTHEWEKDAREAEEHWARKRAAQLDDDGEEAGGMSEEEYLSFFDGPPAANDGPELEPFTDEELPF